jgi:hypothetical protein
MMGRVDETWFCRIKTKDAYCEVQLPRRNVQPMEASMQKTVLTTLGALLISGLAIQMATASEHYHRSKAYVGRDLSEFRRSYNQVSGPIYVITPRVIDNPYADTRDPSRVGGLDPSLHPAN